MKIEKKLKRGESLVAVEQFNYSNIKLGFTQNIDVLAQNIYRHSNPADKNLFKIRIIVLDHR